MDHEHHPLVNIPPSKVTLQDYIPLFTVVAIIMLATGAVAWQTGFTLIHLFGYSMGFFFIIFGLFKLLDLPNFAMGYREYDLITRRFPPWGYIYPFIEVTLGVLYVAGFNEPWLTIVTLAVSAFICLGVAIKLAKHELIHCVCLGNILKVPLTYVSLVEYALMGAMALAMLFI